MLDNFNVIYRDPYIVTGRKGIFIGNGGPEDVQTGTGKRVEVYDTCWARSFHHLIIDILTAMRFTKVNEIIRAILDGYILNTTFSV